ncbi:N-acetylmuramic acid 6-phosphate etherase [Paenibacillus radicis (ex Xue et al. 2023)]|uniref:N-acetylmuramic acid 6-phosphate etherase n=1 Tax=Paenibacillus radicis (ex Xue et al. 2023) TaxID=2972489 RepID=A0ABT1YIJ2_9BACL|nr:N-acetylmuramic acid 6-phosphate etherase [Paenibacillus radicis (ex Xue et al. 2023)]MCR8633002.1 N-acetylmuramic acid 6-phosphate etherase [Paenibacillus radicis (ex Xue et al. 2023)]
MANTKAALLITEQRNEKSVHLDQLSVRETVELMNQEDQTVALSVQTALPQISSAIEAIVQAVKTGGRIFYIGAGSSGRLGVLDASECPPTFGVDPGLVVGLIAGGEKAITRSIENAEDDYEAGRRELANKVTSKDAVVGIAASGSTQYVVGALQEANRIGALTVAISCNSNTLISAEAQYRIEVPVGPEIVTGSTRLKAGTATKMVLNMISTAVMIQLGKVYGNLMVNVQATNIKLKDRVVRIVREATGASEETACTIADQAKGDARAAILMIKYQISYEEARKELEEANDHFGHAFISLAKR